MLFLNEKKFLISLICIFVIITIKIIKENQIEYR